MTDVSTVNGTLYISTSNKKTLDVMIKVLDVSAAWRYPTIINPHEITSAQRSSYGVFHITGTGRWTYENNLREFVANLVADPGLNALSPSVLRTVTDNRYVITIAYHEYEVGSRTLGLGTGVFTKQAGKPLNEMQTSVVTEPPQFLTVKTLHRYGFNHYQWIDFSTQGIRHLLWQMERYHTDPEMVKLYRQLRQYSVKKLGSRVVSHKYDILVDREHLGPDDTKDLARTLLNLIK